MKKFLQIHIDCLSANEGDVLIAELSSIDYYAFEQSENALIAYIKEEDFVEEKLNSCLPGKNNFKISVIEDRNWNEEWESNFPTITVNTFAGIRAAFHAPLKNIAHEIIITPKMSFGTGHHATTYLMIAMMQQLDFKNKEVLDFGTGTAILAILAAKLGAVSIVAIDNDEWSINNALENIEANNCYNIKIEKADNIKSLCTVNIILSNINFNTLINTAGDFSKVLLPGSSLIISGFLIEDEIEICRIFACKDFRVQNSLYEAGWVCILLEKQ